MYSQHQFLCLMSYLMDFIGVLTTQYEDEHFPKLTDLFSELAGDLTPNDTKIEDRKGHAITKAPEKSTNALAAEAFFSIGSLLLEGGKREKAISAYDQAMKFMLGQHEAAIADFDETVQLSSDFAYMYFVGGLAKGMGEKEKTLLFLSFL